MTTEGGDLTLPTFVSWVILDRSLYLSGPQFLLSQNGDNHHHPVKSTASWDKGCESGGKNKCEKNKCNILLLSVNPSLVLRRLGSGWDRPSWDIFSFQSSSGAFFKLWGMVQKKTFGLRLGKATV